MTSSAGPCWAKKWWNGSLARCRLCRRMHMWRPKIKSLPNLEPSKSQSTVGSFSDILDVFSNPTWTCPKFYQILIFYDFSISFLVWNSWQVGSVELEAQDLDEALADVRTPRNCGRCPGGPRVVVPAVPCSTPRLDGCNMCIAGLRCRRKSQGRKSAKSAKTRCQPPWPWTKDKVVNSDE